MRMHLYIADDLPAPFSNITSSKMVFSLPLGLDLFYLSFTSPPLPPLFALTVLRCLFQFITPPFLTAGLVVEPLLGPRRISSLASSNLLYLCVTVCRLFFFSSRHLKVLCDLICAIGSASAPPPSPSPATQFPVPGLNSFYKDRAFESFLNVPRMV